MKILVTGAGGLLGSKLVRLLSKDHEVIPTHSLHSPQPNSIKMNIADEKTVSTVLKSIVPEVVIHAAAMTNVDGCESDRELAWSINAQGTKNIALECRTIHARLIYVSTDYVFDGKVGLYSEQYKTNPINYYGLTKLNAERFVKELCRDSAVARTSVIYGWHAIKMNFATWIVKSLRNHEQVDVAMDHYNSPTLADDLAEILRKIVEDKVSGVYHTCGGERISRYEFALKIAEMFKLDTSLIKPAKMVDIKAWIAKRPRDSSLSIEKLRRDLNIDPPDLAHALDRMKKLEPEAAKSKRAGNCF